MCNLMKKLNYQAKYRQTHRQQDNSGGGEGEGVGGVGIVGGWKDRAKKRKNSWMTVVIM